MRHRGLGQPHLSFRQRELPAALGPRARAALSPATRGGRPRGHVGQGRQEVRADESSGAAGPGRDGAPRHVGVRAVPGARHQAGDALPVRRPAGPVAGAGPEGPRLLNRQILTRTSASDGQRFAMPHKVLQQTYSTRFNDFALESDNYAPFYSRPSAPRSTSRPSGWLACSRWRPSWGAGSGRCAFRGDVRQRRKPPGTATPSAYRHRASRRLH